MKHLHGSYKITVHPDGPEGEEVEVDFTPPFRRLKMIPDLSTALGVELPAADQYHTEGKSQCGVCISLLPHTAERC